MPHRDRRRSTPATRFGTTLGVTTVLCAVTLGWIAPRSAHAASPPHARTGWTTLHADAGNRKYVATRTARSYVRSWHALEGAATLWAPTIGLDGRLFQTTGLGPGHSNLHAFDQSGRLLWEAPPWNEPSDLDACALTSSPVVDRAGDIFLGDCNQLWSFTSGGAVRWVIDLPGASPDAPWQEATRHAKFNPIVTPVLTGEGHVLGVTAFGQVVVADRATGRLVAPILELPGAQAARATDPPLSPTTFQGPDGPTLDPELADPIWQLIFGGVLESANTPSVEPKTGRVFVVGTSPTPDQGALYALSLRDGEMHIDFQTPVGPGSGSSPSLSPDGRQVYVSDQTGVLYAIDTRSGRILWQTGPGYSESGSPSVGPNGRVYLLQRGKAAVAFGPDGTKLWEADLGALAAAELPVNPTLGPPEWVGDGLITVTDDALLVPIHLGYFYSTAGREVRMPVREVLVALDPATGRLLRKLVEESDTSEGLTVVDPRSGMLFAIHGTIFATATAPLADLVGPLLGDGLHLLRAHGGLEAFAPASPQRTHLPAVRRAR